MGITASMTTDHLGLHSEQWHAGKIGYVGFASDEKHQLLFAASQPMPEVKNVLDLGDSSNLARHLQMVLLKDGFSFGDSVQLFRSANGRALKAETNSDLGRIYIFIDTNYVKYGVMESGKIVTFRTLASAKRRLNGSLRAIA